MTLGQQSGPPASTKQVQELLTLLKAAGHTDFRDARGPMGFTQRQAAGKFTRDEATGFISQLQEAESSEGFEAAVVAPEQRLSDSDRLLRRIPAEQLADELQRRGWTAGKPSTSAPRARCHRH
jgi:hypothetical protein